MSLADSYDIFASADTLLHDLLAVSLTGINLLRPLYGPAGELNDFAIEYLNPAGQRILGLAEQPSGTLLTHFPGSVATGVFDYYRRVYQAEATDLYEVNYQADGLDNYFRLAARRSGERLLVSFTDTADQPRTPVENALREAQAVAQAAHAEAELQRQRLHEVLMALPAQVATYHGPEHVFSFVNPRFQAFVPQHAVLGRPVREVAQEAVAPDVFALFDQVYATGQPVEVRELEVTLTEQQPGRTASVFVNAFYLPLRNAEGHIDGLLDFSYDVTEQVLARRQVEQLNQELEARVQERTRAAQAARAEAEAQRAELQHVFEQAPVAIAIYRGPELIIELANSAIGKLWGRPVAQVIGRPHFEALPDARGQGLEQIFSRVLQTGEPFTAIEIPMTLARQQAGLPAQGYFNCTWQPLRNAQAQITGLILVGVEVTGQVLARQRAEALQAELLAAARRQAQERETLYQVFEQTPAAICIQRGAEHRFEYVNPAYQALFADRVFPGRTPAEALPEAFEQGFVDLLDQVYRTGETFRGTELPVVLKDAAGTPVRTIYFNFTYQALRENGQTVGISTFAYDVTEQVRARQEREVQQRRLYALFEQAPAGICIHAGPNLVYEFINPSYQRLLPGRALLGRPLFEALPELVGTDVEALLRHAYATGETHQVQDLLIPVARAEGEGELEDRYFTFVYQARRDEHGQVNAIVNFVFEVTEQVRARRKVEDSEQQVRAVVEGAPFPIGVYVGPEFRIQLANQAFLAGWGKGPDVLGRRFAEVLPELENQAVFEQLEQVFTTGQPLHLRNQELEVVMNGVPQTFYYNYSFIPLRDTHGQVYGVLNTATDVTDQIVARQQVEEAAAELRLLTAHAPAFLFRTDPAGHMTYLNEAFFEWTGLARAQLATLDDVWSIVHPEDVAPVQASFEAAVAAGQGWESMPYRMRRRDGQYRWTITRAQPYLGPDGTVAGHSGINLEIHEQVELQRQLQRTNVDLDNFIYTASHDLKAPITNIEGLLLALQHELPAASRVGDVPQMLQLMQEAVERFKRTIAHLTDVSRLQKEYNPPLAQVALAAVIEEVRLDLTPLLLATQARLEVDVPADCRLIFSEKNLRSVVYNLLSNALKYRHPDRVPRVHIRCRAEAGYQVLQVQDNGLGIDLAHGQEQLFQLFQRLHTHVEGTGIGLYMVKKIVENAGGHITVQSQLGQGSTFAVYFLR
ncbi:PAS domain-containing protein [Hymenobacter weizhouensis]|uniref:PAS domain-containing protein n=1 Tax=Hymenobacter sp. YIM 151500-1 TaxID=2987689 RepID=UPI002225CADD|nr:PAS domain-containing protein [Hymenobacter sp. YIM 151500-1]UYZ61419.1 PAS domain-containing protein [Hymenobacter sp. YIM 151500-1]